MKKTFFTGWWKFFLAFGLAFGFGMSGASCSGVQTRQKTSCWPYYCPDRQSPRGRPCPMTKCGMRLYGPSVDCAGLQAAEDKAVAVFGEHFQSPCEKLKNWNVFVQPPGYEISGWEVPSPDAGNAVGMTFCEELEMQVETDDWRTSSLSHEMLHVLQWCGGSKDAGTDFHAGWWDGGLPWVPDAIDRAAGLK
ncbi:MAG: hypothetical protein AAB467_02445 [Patescibacteria group bacterium]